MARQKSEDRVVPQRRRKPGATALDEPAQGGKAIPVVKQTWQLGLPFGTAEVGGANAPSSDAEAGTDRSVPAPRAVPKPNGKEKRATSATMEMVCEGLREAFEKVASNRGAAGPDGRSVDEVRAHLPRLLPSLVSSLLDGSYQPGDIRRVWIPKAGGGERGLGIPDVIDRMVQEAVRRVLEPLYEPTFHPSSHGFRPGRSCHTAIQEAKGHLEEGYEWVVDLDLEKFFDRVNHQRLMARLALRVADKRLLVLVGRMLKGV